MKKHVSIFAICLLGLVLAATAQTIQPAVANLIKPAYAVYRYQPPMASQSPCTPTGAASISGEPEVQVFPNPSHGTFSIGSSMHIRRVEVLNLLGQQAGVMEIPSAGNQREILVNMQDLPGGLYFLKLEGPAGELVTRKITIATP